MKKTIFLLAVALGFMLANCGGSDQTALKTAAIPAVVAAVPVPDPSSKQADAKTEVSRLAETTKESGSGQGIARSFQQRERLRQLASERKIGVKKTQKSKQTGFFSSLLGTGNNRGRKFKFGRNGNNIKSMKPFWGGSRGRRRR